MLEEAFSMCDMRLANEIVHKIHDHEHAIHVACALNYYSARARFDSRDRLPRTTQVLHALGLPDGVTDAQVSTHFYLLDPEWIRDIQGVGDARAHRPCTGSSSSDSTHHIAARYKRLETALEREALSLDPALLMERVCNQAIPATLEDAFCIK
jgi:hypothetical protein